MSGIILLVTVAIIVLLERLILGGRQIRTGPGTNGIIQTILDRIKLLMKNNGSLFGGLIIIILCVFVYSSEGMLMVVMILVAVGMTIFGCILSSGNMYIKLRGMRLLLVILGFDIILLLVTLGEGILIGIVFGLVCLSETGRSPVDIIEGESELVSGFNTEFGGALFTCFFVGEMIIVCFSFLMIGGNYRIGLIYRVFFVLMTRCSLPRLKYNEVIGIFWRGNFICVLYLLI